ncbi:MAG: hypothetical protein IE909_16705 [Campylobacterales bacterium]|nr:hypothetical protein [Campylobacterales bacterium]
MLREIIRPTHEYYNLHIPKEYMGKEIEVIILPLFDLKKTTHREENTKSFNPKDFYAAANLNKTEIDKYLANSINEWE